MTQRPVFRVQAKDGRGPFRPGFSVKWSDTEGDNRLPTYIDEFGPVVINNALAMFNERGGALGCGVATREQVAKWFTPTERSRLRAYGYRLVMMTAEEILAESDNQLLFWRKRPLNRDVLVIPWGDVP